MVSPLVDIVFNFMATMFIFLMIYMLVAIPTKIFPIRFANVFHPPAVVGAPYVTGKPAYGGVGPYAFAFSRGDAAAILMEMPDGSLAPADDQCRLDVDRLHHADILTLDDGDAVRIDRTSGVVEGVLSGSVRGKEVTSLTVMAADIGRRVSCDPSADLDTGRDGLPVKVVGRAPDGSCVVRHCLDTIRDDVAIEISPIALPFDPQKQPLTPPPPETLQASTVEGVPMRIDQQVTGGVEAYEFRIASGRPEWLAFDPTTGRLSGAPTRSGTVRIAMELKDAQTRQGDWDLAIAARSGPGRPYHKFPVTIDVAPYAPPEAEIVMPAFGRIGVTVRGAVTVLGGYGEIRFELLSPLPAGVRMTDDGEFIGAPTEAGVYKIEVRVVDQHPDRVLGETVAGLKEWRVIGPRPNASVGPAPENR